MILVFLPVPHQPGNGIHRKPGIDVPIDIGILHALGNRNRRILLCYGLPQLVGNLPLLFHLFIHDDIGRLAVSVRLHLNPGVLPGLVGIVPVLGNVLFPGLPVSPGLFF
ncbi:hypothetical protein SDC9_182568 [bioreactor metagenome]|uniref:Uncharacterized protein n=1 Tax=bioreactor metagenome TaxID=1076179 RepID=A0A645HG37_9ZZZZ